MEADKEFREWQPTFIKQFNVLKRLNISLAISLLRSLIRVGWEEVRFSVSVCNYDIHSVYIVSTPTVLYCKFFRHHCSHNCPFKILYCKLLSSMEPYGIDSQMQKPNYNIEICDTLRRGFPNSNCTGFPIPAAHRVH